MDILEQRKQRKKDAERLRRRQINDRLIRLRDILRLEEDIKRIYILKSAVDRLRTIQSNGAYKPEYTCDTSTTIDQQLEQRIPIVRLYPKVEQGKSFRATVEQYRRRFERVEYDRIRSLLSYDEKVSDVHLLDKLIETIEDKENQNSNNNDFCKDKIITSTLTQNTERRRQGLKLLDTNQPTHSVQYFNANNNNNNNNNNSDNNMNREINESQQQPCIKSIEPPSRHNENVSNIKKYWRPWEDN